ncbi:hypothetical protein ACFW9M_28565 [Streptomyces lydicus]|uniref:hypothetical protein n=1 Tax=Streptomyces lydicus TaxID=47763 RepID=UPI001F2F5353|nr:hypothetical protein [Streptomyces lydicus]
MADADGVVAGTADCLIMPNRTRGGRGESAGCYKVQLLAADDVHTFYEACGFKAQHE